VGVERKIYFPEPYQFSWQAFVECLQRSGENPILRMIDGLPAFPDETPADSWWELRISLRGGMITLRRQDSPTIIRCIAWGTGDANLLASLDVAASAAAHVGNGQIIPDL
jgi:hypothetical protein